MPLAQLRICEPCGGRIRWAPCSIACRVPDGGQRDSWVENLQDGAGTILKETA
jgi:hypothetical protein